MSPPSIRWNIISSEPFSGTRRCDPRYRPFVVPPARQPHGPPSSSATQSSTVASKFGNATWLFRPGAKRASWPRGSPSEAWSTTSSVRISWRTSESPRLRHGVDAAPCVCCARSLWPCLSHRSRTPGRPGTSPWIARERVHGDSSWYRAVGCPPPPSNVTRPPPVTAPRPRDRGRSNSRRGRSRVTPRRSAPWPRRPAPRGNPARRLARREHVRIRRAEVVVEHEAVGLEAVGLELAPAGYPDEITRERARA